MIPPSSFRILGYPGQSKERDTEVRLTRGKIFRVKIRMYLQLYVVRNYNFKPISVKEMEPNFVRMKVAELKKYLKSVLRISRFALFVKAHELVIKLTSISEAIKSVWTSASTYTGRQ